ADAQFARALPRLVAASRAHLVGDGDLLGLRGEVGARGVLAAAVAQPGRRVELEAAVVAVAGVDAPVATGLALRDLVPDGVTGQPLRALVDDLRDGLLRDLDGQLRASGLVAVVLGDAVGDDLRTRRTRLGHLLGALVERRVLDLLHRRRDRL